MGLAIVSAKAIAFSSSEVRHQLLRYSDMALLIRCLRCVPIWSQVEGIACRGILPDRKVTGQLCGRRFECRQAGRTLEKCDAWAA